MPPTEEPARVAVVGSVGIKLRLRRQRAEPRQCLLQKRQQPEEVWHIRAAEPHAERQAVAIGQQMILAAALAAVGRILAGLFAPFFAGTNVESSTKRFFL